MKTATRVEEKYRNKALAENSLVYFQDRKGQHVVTHYMHCGEDIGPDVFRYATIEQARATWTRLRGLLSSRGYSRVG